jgi:hypothetical protein
MATRSGRRLRKPHARLQRIQDASRGAQEYTHSHSCVCVKCGRYAGPSKHLPFRSARLGCCAAIRFESIPLGYQLELLALVRAVLEASMAGILWAVIVVLFVLWVLGFALHVGGSLIHVLLVIALIVLVYNIVTGRGARL